MSSPAVPNGHRVLSLTNDPQFAKRGNFGHELLYPMQGHKATCMQGQPNGTDTWDQIGFGNAFSSDDRQASAALAPPVSSLQPAGTIPCRYPTCYKIFKRDSDQSRHEQSLHFKHSGLHLCPIAGCRKSYGKGYSRPDKVTEHLWKKHANLAFTKAWVLAAGCAGPSSSEVMPSN